MTEDEIEIVAKTLAGLGSAPSPEREANGGCPPTDRHRARVAIATLDRLREDTQAPCSQDNARDGRKRASEHVPRDEPKGVAVNARSVADRKVYPSRIIRIEGSQAYLKPILRACTDWISIESLDPSETGKAPAREVAAPPRSDPDP